MQNNYISYSPYFQQSLPTIQSLYNPSSQQLSIFDYLNYDNNDTEHLPTILKPSDYDVASYTTELPVPVTQRELSNPTVYTHNNVVDKIISKARSYIGTPYRWGGTSENGFDCSGLIQTVFASAGINVPRTAAQQGKSGDKINFNDVQKGDIIQFASNASPSGKHIGLVSKIDSNGQIYIIDAANKKSGVVERKLPKMKIENIRRYI